MKAYLVRNILRELSDSFCEEFNFTGTSFHITLFDAEIGASDYEDFAGKILFSENNMDAIAFDSLYGLSAKLADYNCLFPSYKNDLVTLMVKFFTAFDGDCEVRVHSADYSSSNGAKGFLYFPNGGYCSFRVTESGEITSLFFDEYSKYVCSAKEIDEICRIADELTHPSW